MVVTVESWFHMWTEWNVMEINPIIWILRRKWHISHIWIINNIRSLITHKKYRFPDTFREARQILVSKWLALSEDLWQSLDIKTRSVPFWPTLCNIFSQLWCVCDINIGCNHIYVSSETGVPFHQNFNSIFKKGSSKKFPMRVAPMSR